MKAMTTPGKGNYGLGVEVNNVDGLKVIEHNGGIERFNTDLIYVFLNSASVSSYWRM